MKVAVVRENRKHLPIGRLCTLVGISVSGYYAYLKRPPSKRAQENQKIMREIRLLFDESRKSYGCRRISRALQKKNVLLSKSKANRLMQKMGLKSTHTKKYRVQTTDSSHTMPVASNLLNREFEARFPNEKWVGDITYIPTHEGFVYLAVVIDLFSRKVLSFAIERHMRASLCVRALQKAFLLRPNRKRLLWHTDQGSQYASEALQRLVQENRGVSSMSRKGNCWDNAVAESFFKTIKTECVDQNTYATITQAKEDISDYIYNFYNNQRIHSALDYKSPVQYEIEYYNNLQRAA